MVSELVFLYCAFSVKQCSSKLIVWCLLFYGMMPPFVCVPSMQQFLIEIVQTGRVFLVARAECGTAPQVVCIIVIKL